MNIDTNNHFIYYKLDINSSNPIIAKFTNFVHRTLNVKSLEEAKEKILINENRELFDEIKNLDNITNIKVIYDPNMSYYGLFSWIFSTIVETEVDVFNKFLNKTVKQIKLYKVYFGFKLDETLINNSPIDNPLNESLPPPIPSPFPEKGPNIVPDPRKYVNPLYHQHIELVTPASKPPLIPEPYPTSPAKYKLNPPLTTPIESVMTPINSPSSSFPQLALLHDSINIKIGLAAVILVGISIALYKK